MHGHQWCKFITESSIVHQGIFTSKLKSCCSVKFSCFCSICKIWWLQYKYLIVFSQLTSIWEPGIAGCSRWSDIYLGGGFIDHCHAILFSVLNFRGWSQPWNYFNREVFFSTHTMWQWCIATRQKTPAGTLLTTLTTDFLLPSLPSCVPLASLGPLRDDDGPTLCLL